MYESCLTAAAIRFLQIVSAMMQAISNKTIAKCVTTTWPCVNSSSQRCENVRLRESHHFNILLMIKIDLVNSTHRGFKPHGSQMTSMRVSYILNKVEKGAAA